MRQYLACIASTSPRFELELDSSSYHVTADDHLRCGRDEQTIKTEI